MVRAAVTYLRALWRCGDDAARRRLGLRMPAVAQAVALSRSAPPLRRWVVEARLLAGESSAAIAGKVDSRPDVVEMYHDLFFDVRSRLTAGGYVLHTVIGPKAHAGLTEADTDVLLKLHGYGGGPAAVDAFLHHLAHPPDAGQRPEALGDAELEDWALRLRVRAAVLARVVPADPSTAGKLLALHLQTRTEGRKRASALRAIEVRPGGPAGERPAP